MFHIYEGFHLVDAYHKMRHQRKYNPDTKRAIKIALVAIVTLLLWMPYHSVGIFQSRRVTIATRAILMARLVSGLYFL